MNRSQRGQPLVQTTQVLAQTTQALWQTVVIAHAHAQSGEEARAQVHLQTLAQNTQATQILAEASVEASTQATPEGVRETFTQATQELKLLSTQDVDFSVLSLDGGGIRGLSSLIILYKVMIEVTGNGKDPIYPWKYFKIICGTSTGGLIALMLGRLHMSLQQTIKAYIRLGQEIFLPTKWFWKEGRYKAKNLERAIKRIVGEAQDGGEGNEAKAEEVKKGIVRKIISRNPKKLSARDEENEKKGEAMMMKDDRENCCQIFVCSVDSADLGRAVHLRTYGSEYTPAADRALSPPVPSYTTPGLFPNYALSTSVVGTPVVETPVADSIVANCKIWEAACATSAVPYFFKPIVIKDPEGTETTYVDGGLRCNNPTRQLIKEIRALGLSNQRTCILSIRTGRSGSISIPKVGGIAKLQLLGVVTALRKMATSCKTVKEELVEELSNRKKTKDVYVRLNVESGMEMGMEDWKKYKEIVQSTVSYIRDPGVQEKVNLLKQHIWIRPECQ